MVEELAEQREPGIEGRRQAFVRRDVRQNDGVGRFLHLDAVVGSEIQNPWHGSGGGRLGGVGRRIERGIVGRRVGRGPRGRGVLDRLVGGVDRGQRLAQRVAA